MLVLMFSLAGVPPMLGFFAKFGVWQAGVDAGLVWLVVVSAFASAIGAYYYLRIVFFMYFGSEDGAIEVNGSKTLWVFLMGAAAIIGIAWVPGINMFGIGAIAELAATSLVN